MRNRINDNIISDIKIEIFIKYGIMLHTGLTDSYGHTIYFECKAYSRDGMKEVKLTDTGEDLIDRDEYAVLLEAKEFIENNYYQSSTLNMTF